MALNEQYFVTGDLETVYVDKDTGLPLSGGFINFYRDVARNTPKTVYELTGAPPNYSYVPLPNPVPLSAVGTPQNAGGDNVVIYYYPYDNEGNLDLYYADVRDSMDAPQFTREAWPNITAADNPVNNDFSNQNQISNSQFTQVFLNQGKTTVYSVSAATNQVFIFAPNWDFVISGTGTVTVEQIAVAGVDNVATSPPYVLDVAVSAGITSCYLRQRFDVNSGLWASTANESIFLAGTLIARNENAGTTGIQMFYVASSGGSPISIVNASFNNASYQVLTGTTADPIPLSTDTNTDDEGYVDIYLSFLSDSEVRISSIQVLPTLNEAGATVIPYDLNSSNREQALMGDYYIPRLNSRPAASLLVGWDFTVNPYQFGHSGAIINTAAYICDQTIGFAGSTGNIASSIDPITSGIALNTGGSNDAFYLMQYLSGQDAKKILGTPLSVNIFAYMTSMSTSVKMSVYLFRAPSSSSIPTLPTSIGTVATDGTFTLTAGGWTQIPRSGLDTAQATLPYLATDADINDLDNDLSFTGWELTDAAQIGDTKFFAMVVTFAYIDTSTTLTINSISLIPSEIPARPAPESLSEVTSKCQYYYEKSYSLPVFPGATNNVDGAIVCEQQYANSGGLYMVYPLIFGARYETRKRIHVPPALYSPISGTLGKVNMLAYQGNNVPVVQADATVAGNWTLTDNGETGFNFEPVDRTTAVAHAVGGAFSVPGAESIILFHYVADARLGIV